ncbi:MAG: ribosome maturation factor RimM [Bacteroidota bacterium]
MPVPGGAKAGKISKPYGLQGRVNMILDPEAGKHIEIDNPLFINIDGQRVPFFVEDFEPVSLDQAIVKFEFINSVEEAREVSGCEVYLDPSQKSASKSGMKDYSAAVGYDAFDQDVGYLGKITDFIQHDMNPVLMVDYKGKELMVPAVDELIQQINHKERSIYFHLPEGLTTL